MLRRALLLGVLPALLALAVLFGTPATGISAPDATASSWKTADTLHPVARGHLIDDDKDVSVSQSADNDDGLDDLIVRLVTAIIWPQSALNPSILPVDDIVGPSHPPCAAPSRAPPAA